MLGYYLFLGRGDWGTSRDQTLDPTFGGNVKTSLLGDWGPHRTGTPLTQAPEWTSAWDSATWCRHIDFLVDDLGADTLALMMNGYELPYPSSAFPDVVEMDHANVRREFLQQVLDYAIHRGLRLCATFATTGHAVGCARAHPEWTTVDRAGHRSRENLCHHHPQARRYAMTVAHEMLTRYHGFSLLCFHPPENTTPCYCDYCQAAFTQATGNTMSAAAGEQIDTFFWESCLAFQREMEQAAAALVPGADMLTFTIPGRFETDFAAIGKAIPKTTQLMHWDYWSFGERLPELLKHLDILRSQGHRVGFTPSAGWGLDALGPDYGKRVVEQIQAVTNAGVRDILYLVGAIWHPPALLATSRITREPQDRTQNC